MYKHIPDIDTDQFPRDSVNLGTKLPRASEYHGVVNTSLCW